jgi:hypothetical protein
VYDVLNETIQPIKKNGSRVDVIVSAAKNARWESNALIIDDQRSLSVVSPWTLR